MREIKKNGMKQEQKSGPIINRKRLRSSFKSAMVGIYRLVRDEQNARIHSMATILVFAMAIAFRINRIEAAVLFMAVILVFGLEIINTAIEDLLDHLHPHQHQTIARIKDGLSGAVLVAAVIAAVVAFLVFLPYVMDWVKSL